MKITGQLRKTEILFLISCFALWLVIYLASRFTFEMNEIKLMPGILKWAAFGVSPIAIYAAVRTGFAEKVKWYGFLGYLFGYIAVLTFATQYMFIQSNLLWNAAVNEQVFKQVKVLEVRKVFKRKLGFDHTEVAILLDEQPMKMEARPYTYFYLKDKKQLDVKIGHSEMGAYVTNIRSTFEEKTVARWHHLKDMVYRLRWIFGIIILIIVASIIKTSYFPDLSGAFSEHFCGGFE